MPTTYGPRGFYTAVICRNGHVLTSMAELRSEEATPFCPHCAAPTISACDSCHVGIPGEVREAAVFGGYDAPVYCRYCAAAMPWTAAGLDALRELTNLEAGLSERRARHPQSGLG